MKKGEQPLPDGTSRPAPPPPPPSALREGCWRVAPMDDERTAIRNGWQPIGGMTSTSHPTGGYLELGPVGRGIKGTILFSQALVKYATKLDTERMSTGTYDSSKAVP